jgi:hypothetical protein
MRLYATTTSERATKGQGGNDYLKIIVRNEGQQCIGYITFKNKTCDISIIQDIKTSISYPLWIGTNDDTKGKQQKGECNHHIIRDDYGKEYCQECGKYSFN